MMELNLKPGASRKKEPEVGTFKKGFDKIKVLTRKDKEKGQEKKSDPDALAKQRVEVARLERVRMEKVARLQEEEQLAHPDQSILLRLKNEIDTATKALTKSAEELRGLIKNSGGAAVNPDEFIPGKTPQASSAAPIEKPVERKEKEPLSFSPEKEVDDFIGEFSLGKIVPNEFYNLSSAQQLLVIQGLKQRIVDVVRDDAQTQYSEKIKTIANKSKIRGILEGILFKEMNLKDAEARSFKKLRYTDEFNDLIQGDLGRLTDMAADRSVFINKEGKPEIDFISTDRAGINQGSIEAGVIAYFNYAASNFRSIPYEWGQEKSGRNKKAHDKAKAEYDRARNEALWVIEEKTGPEFAVTQMLQLDNLIQMDQLINTHPEFEEELKLIEKSAGGKEIIQYFINSLNTLTGGKNLTNKALFAGGFVARGLTASMGIATGIAAPITGAVIGGLRGRMRGKETLATREKQARYGQKDTSKQRTATFDATQLTHKLGELQQKIGWASSDAEKQKLLASLSARIEYTQEKIENGEVNFGDAKSSLVNQYTLINRLNSTISLRASYDPVINVELMARLEKFSSFAESKIDERQREFVNAQMKRGALMGAGAATAGYLVKYFGENLGLWGGHGVENVQTRPEHMAGATQLQDDTTPGSMAWARAHPLAAAKADSALKFHNDSVAHADSLAQQHPDSAVVASDSTTQPGSGNAAGRMAGFSQDAPADTAHVNPVTTGRGGGGVTQTGTPDTTGGGRGGGGRMSGFNQTTPDTTHTNPVVGKGAPAIKTGVPADTTSTPNRMTGFKTDSAADGNAQPGLGAAQNAAPGSGVGAGATQAGTPGVVVGSGPANVAGVAQNNLEESAKLEHHFQSLTLKHIWNGKTDDITLDKELAARTKNISANLARLAHHVGKGTAGVTNEQFDAAFKMENGIPVPIDRAKADAVMEHLYNHSGEFAKSGGLFAKDPDSAIGYIKNEDWHARAVEAGHANAKIDDFHDIPNPPHGIDVGGHEVGTHLSPAEIERLAKISDANMRYGNPDTYHHVFPGEAVSEQDVQSITPDQVQQVAPNATSNLEAANTALYTAHEASHASVDAAPIQQDKMLDAITAQAKHGDVEQVYDYNLHHIFHDDRGRLWEEVYKSQTATENIKEGATNQELTHYLQKLQEVSGLRPKGRRLFFKPETVENYIERALRALAKKGELDQVIIK